jgi:tRNA(Ile)-lysidine synthase
MQLPFINNFKDSKNLLAFSGGVDSTALFFLLIENNIQFDIAIVNYGIREQSKEEVEYSKYLANRYDKKVFIKHISLTSTSNFEKNARDYRYQFFEDIIQNQGYNTLITAHQLNDKLEWFLMQFSKGAGLFELIGLDYITIKNRYTLYRPLLEFSKDELIEFLDSKNIKYFIDQSNLDTKYKRNFFRHNFSNEFLKLYKDGVKNSFSYLQDDIMSLKHNFKLLEKEKELCIYEYNGDLNIAIKVVDMELKNRQILISKAQRDEILRQKQIVITNTSIAILEKLIYIAPYYTQPMPKQFKELCRIRKIPKNIRSYLYMIERFK